MKGVKHYKRDGTEHKGSSHKMPDGTLHSNKTHTKKSVEEIRKNGIKVLSYFISDSDYNRESRVRDFKRMYGADARFINPTNMMEVAKTMNAVFLEK